MNAPTRLACPTCKRSIEWSEEFPWRPFCSERCKLVDLGDWFAEAHKIPGEPVDESVERQSSLLHHGPKHET